MHPPKAELNRHIAGSVYMSVRPVELVDPVKPDCIFMVMSIMSESVLYTAVRAELLLEMCKF